MMSTTPISRKLTFWELILSNKIEIPIIQRDYAQGREGKEELRDGFLSALFNALARGDSLELDFVYGDVRGTKENKIFQPLDGQQRLTTLFLLHWYVGTKEGKQEELKTAFTYTTNAIEKNNKSKQANFTYETRISSREFCAELISKGVNTEDIERYKKLSDVIVDCPWFFLSWQKDPTIKAMLTMLNATHEKFKDTNGLWDKLTKKNAITFRHLPLKGFGLSDDLYIKMNARGKPLTDFENFKARFEKRIKDWEEGIEPLKRFDHKIDKEWTDLFWKHRDSENKIDQSLLKFVSGIAMNCYARYEEIHLNDDQKELIRKELAEKLKEKSVTEEAIKREGLEKRIAELFNDTKRVNPSDFCQEKFKYLKDCFEIYSSGKDEIFPENVDLWGFCKNSTMFKQFIGDGNTIYKQRVLFFAQTEYLLKHKFDAYSFSDWMRVVRNIVENSTIDSASTFIGAVNLIKELVVGGANIYEHLAQANIKSGFAKDQVEEEVLKARILSNDITNKEVLFKAEDTIFCKGRIKFALYCIDVETAQHSFQKEKLSQIQKVINEHLSYDDVSNEFRRALLTIDKNDFYTYWWGAWSNCTNSKKYCLIENTLDLQNNFTRGGNYQSYLKELLNMLTEKDLDEIISNYSCADNIPNWTRRLIKEPELLNESCESHYIGIPNEGGCCFLFGNKKRPRSKEECKEVK